MQGVQKQLRGIWCDRLCESRFVQFKSDCVRVLQSQIERELAWVNERAIGVWNWGQEEMVRGIRRQKREESSKVWMMFFLHWGRPCLTAPIILMGHHNAYWPSSLTDRAGHGDDSMSVCITYSYNYNMQEQSRLLAL